MRERDKRHRERKTETESQLLGETTEREQQWAEFSPKGTLTPSYRVRVLPVMSAGVATLPLPGPQGVGPGLHLPG